MGLFGKSDEWTKLDEKAFGKMIMKLPEWSQLLRMIGTPYAEGTLKALWNKFGSSGTFQYKDKAALTQFQEAFSSLLKHEMSCVLQAHYHIGALSIKARLGGFTNEFATKVMQPADYGAKLTDANADRAAQYIIHTSNSLRGKADDPAAPVKRSDITLALQNAALYDVRSEATLRDLHRRLVNQAGLRPTRCVDKQAPYPSTGGAAYLLTKTFEFARGIPVPAPNAPEWFDLSCFLLGAVIRSHGFTDGNGRVGRAAYAAAMVKGGLPFVALRVEAEKSIHGLDQVS